MNRCLDLGAARQAGVLRAIKVAHTAVWAFFVSCILGLPIAGVMRRFDVAVWMSVCVLAESLILGLNGGVCPLTTLAARYTADRSPAFDIYLPEWLARWNKVLFGTLFAVNGLIVMGLWFADSAKVPHK